MKQEDGNYENRSNRGTGRIELKILRKLLSKDASHWTAVPHTDVNTVTGDELARAPKGTSVVVDVSNCPNWNDAAVLKLFETSTPNLLTFEGAAAVAHHVAL